MAGIRVYEAARKLSIKTAELMKLLAKLGVAVKSPISFITQDDFNKTANALATSSVDSGGSVTSIAKKPDIEIAEPAPDTGDLSDEETKKDADVIPISRSRKAEEELAVETKADETPKTPPVAPPASEPAGRPRQGVAAVLSYLAIGLASGALIATFALYNTVTEKAALLDTMIAETAVVKADLASAKVSVAATKVMAEKNFSSIAIVRSDVNAVRIADIKSDLKANAASLDEMVTLSTDRSAPRLSDLAKRVGQLADSM